MERVGEEVERRRAESAPSRRRKKKRRFFVVVSAGGSPFFLNLGREMDARVSPPRPAIEKISRKVGQASAASSIKMRLSKAADDDFMESKGQQKSLSLCLSAACLPEQAEPVARVAPELAEGRAVAHFVWSLARSLACCSARESSVSGSEKKKREE